MPATGVLHSGARHSLSRRRCGSRSVTPKERILFLKFYEFNACFVEELDREVVRVSVLVDYAFNSAVDDDTCADGAGLVGYVDGCTLNGHAKF